MLLRQVHTDITVTPYITKLHPKIISDIDPQITTEIKLYIPYVVKISICSDIAHAGS